jgi:hypothetical protein
MSREVWGTFSVRDHLVEHAFVADVLLYDRLLVPTKPEGEDPEEWPRQWELARLNRVLGVLGDLAIPIPWTLQRHEESRRYLQDEPAERARAKSRMVADAAFDIQQALLNPTENRYQATRLLLADYANDEADDRLFQRLRATARARPGATLEAVAAYPSFGAFSADVPVKAQGKEENSPSKEPAKNPLIPPTAIFGWDFFLPDSDEEGEPADLRLLERAVRLASDTEFIEARGRLHDWLGDVSEAISTGALSPADARHDMEGRLKDYQECMKRMGWKRWVRRAIKVADAFAGNLGVVSEVAGKSAEVFFGVADIVGDEWHDKEAIPQRTKVAAIFHDARRKLGWKPLKE